MRHFIIEQVLPEDTRLFRVKEAGWYIFDENHIAQFGPLGSPEECESCLATGGGLIATRPAEARSASGGDPLWLNRKNNLHSQRRDGSSSPLLSPVLSPAPSSLPQPIQSVSSVLTADMPGENLDPRAPPWVSSCHRGPITQPTK
jgi:hypothetical protein